MSTVQFTLFLIQFTVFSFFEISSDLFHNAISFNQVENVFFIYYYYYWFIHNFLVSYHLMQDGLCWILVHRLAFSSFVTGKMNKNKIEKEHQEFLHLSGYFYGLKYCFECVIHRITTKISTLFVPTLLIYTKFYFLHTMFLNEGLIFKFLLY